MRFATERDINPSREKEVQSVLSCYHRCVSGACEFAIVSGASGAGKSWILEKVGSSIIAGGGLFLMGKFDQRQQSKPFLALAAAFDQYVEVLMSEVGSCWANNVVNSLRSTLGQDAYHLVEIIPKLGQLLDSCLYGAAPNYFGFDCRNATDRIQYLLCRFVEVIAVTAQVSLTLCLDDVQWMDEASASVLNRVLAQTRNYCANKFFFLACCRDDEMGPDHPYMTMIQDTKESGVNTTTGMVTCMKEEEINNFVSELLCLSPRLVEPLAHIIYSRTKRNILFVSQLLLSLNRDGLLQIDLGSQRWVWDVQRICSTKLPDNVALCFTNGIAKLPIEVQLGIHTLSMFGASARSDYIAALESQLNVKISEPLQVAEKEGAFSELYEEFIYLLS
jgi:predicted ATPase